MKDRNIINKNNFDISFLECLKKGLKQDELFEIFKYMDSSMKYVHDKGYTISSFNPVNINFVNGNIKNIKFTSLKEFSDDYDDKRDEIKEDIFQSTFLQIGLYTNTLNCLSRSFLREHFDEFIIFLPEDLVPYYRGVVERGFSVYLNDYLIEKERRDFEQLSKDVSNNDNGLSNSKALVKSNGHSLLSTYDSMNSSINNSVYKDLKNRNDNAYVNMIMLPILTLIIGFITFILFFLS